MFEAFLSVLLLLTIIIQNLLDLRPSWKSRASEPRHLQPQIAACIPIVSLALIEVIKIQFRNKRNCISINCCMCCSYILLILDRLD